MKPANHGLRVQVTGDMPEDTSFGYLVMGPSPWVVDGSLTQVHLLGTWGEDRRYGAEHLNIFPEDTISLV